MIDLHNLLWSRWRRFPAKLLQQADGAQGRSLEAESASLEITSLYIERATSVDELAAYEFAVDELRIV